MIKDFESSQKKIWSPSDPKRTEQESNYANKIYLLQNKMNPVASFTMGLIDSFPTTGITKWIANKLGATKQPNHSHKHQKLQRHQVLLHIPQEISLECLTIRSRLQKWHNQSLLLHPAQGKAGQALAKLPVLSKVGAQPIANVLGDMTLDVALDTIPEAGFQY